VASLSDLSKWHTVSKELLVRFSEDQKSLATQRSFGIFIQIPSRPAEAHSGTLFMEELDAVETQELLMPINTQAWTLQKQLDPNRFKQAHPSHCNRVQGWFPISRMALPILSLVRMSTKRGLVQSFIFCGKKRLRSSHEG
jgi:hypothetical protein